MVLAAPERVAVIRGDGSTFTLHEFDLPRPDARLSLAKVGDLVVRRNRVAVSASSQAWIGPGVDDWQQWDETLLLELHGKVVWRRSFWSDDLGPSHQRTISLRLSREGMLAVSAGANYLIWPDGEEDSLGNLVPLAEPFAGPVLAQHAYVSTVVGTEVVDSADTGWILLSGGSEVARFNALTGEVSTQALVFPAGFRMMREPGSERSLAIDTDGSFLVALRNDHVAGVYRSFDGATGWTRIGRTLGQVEFVGVKPSTARI